MNDDIDNEAQALRRADRFSAFVAIRPDPVTAGAGPLANERIAVKDNISVAGLAFTAGHPLFAERIATVDAEAVRRLRAAGGRVVGVTQTDAGGFGVTTPAVCNPVAPDLIVGGSSGGAAAAVAAGLADIGLGTDTGGSVRIPAACCDLFAFKPSYRRELLAGVWPLAPSLDHVGLITRDFGLLAAGAGALLDQPIAPTAVQPRFGLDITGMQRYDPQIALGLLAVVKQLRDAGCIIEPIELPRRGEILAAHSTLVLAEARAVYADLWPAAAARLGEPAQQALAVAAQIDQAAIEQAQASARNIMAALNKLFSRVDVILTPTLAIPPPSVHARTVLLGGKEVPTLAALVSEACLANVTGLPALVMPLAMDAAAMPVSVQIMAARDQDAMLFRYGAYLQTMAAAGSKESAAPHPNE